VAGVLQEFVRAEWRRLRTRCTVERISLLQRLPLSDVKYWLQDHPDDWAFLPYEDLGPVMERLLLVEACATQSRQRLRVSRAGCAQCAALSCSLELFTGALLPCTNADSTASATA
jgi:hypothetical protein